MPDAIIPLSPPRQSRFAANFLIILGAFCVLVLANWPDVLSFDLWIFEDRSSFMHLDDLVARHLRLGVNILYSYGLLPVLLQHLVFLPFGRGFKPMLGLNVLVFVLNAVFWAGLLEHLPAERRWLLAVVALSPIILIVNPNWPYSLALLSMMFALLFALKDRLDIALAVSAAGCFCVPSLPLVLTVVIALLIVVNWWLAPATRGIGKLAALLAPGALSYATFAVLLGAVYGVDSLAATAIPLAGARFYKENGYSGLAAFLAFLHPVGYGVKYYLAYYTGSSVTWFTLCSLFLFGLSVVSLARLLKGRRLTPSASFVVLFAILLFVFVFFVYGARGQHHLYEGIIAAATLVGISTIAQIRARRSALIAFLTMGIMAQSGGAYKTLTLWRTTVRSPESFGLYADPQFIKELGEIVEVSRSRKTLMLGYATGIHNYYSTLEDPDAWFLLQGLLFPSQQRAIIDQIQQADVVVEVLTSPPSAVTNDPKIQAALNEMQPGSPKMNFLLRTRSGPR